MANNHLYMLAKTNIDVIILLILGSLIVVFGGIAVYLVEHEHTGANITNLADSFWWAVVTIATVGYGDYYPVTAAGRIIAIFMMLSGIGIFATFVSMLAHRRLQRAELRLKSKTEARSDVLGYGTKIELKNKIDVIESLTEEDFDTFVIMMKSLRLRLLEESKVLSKCSRCGMVYHKNNKAKFCSNCGLDLGGSGVSA
ncbi:MAG TPA: ion channel [Nitrososphaeraceae archaeon]|jgi:voltage-gated potassium channel|nr:ion channel [Nitrososphaeraceae archaeon]